MRNEKIKEQLLGEISDLQLKARENIKKDYISNKNKYILDFLNVIDSLLIRNLELQQENKLKKIKYIWINCLRVSVETESYEYVIKVYDEDIYLNNNVAEVVYVPEYCLKHIENDKETISKLVMNKIIRAKQYEVKDLQKWYIWDTYIQEIPSEMEEAVEQIKSLSSYQKLDKDTDVIMYYGEVYEYGKKKYHIE